MAVALTTAAPISHLFFYKMLRHTCILPVLAMTTLQFPSESYDLNISSCLIFCCNFQGPVFTLRVFPSHCPHHRSISIHRICGQHCAQCHGQESAETSRGVPSELSLEDGLSYLRSRLTFQKSSKVHQGLSLPSL